MSDIESVWIPLVDEPIGSIVTQIVDEDEETRRLIHSPRRILAFRTFAYIRVGLLLGQLLVEHDLPPYDGSDTWIDALLRDPALHQRVVQEVREVADEIASDPQYADDEPLGPDDDAKARFREFAKRQLGNA